MVCTYVGIRSIHITVTTGIHNITYCSWPSYSAVGSPPYNFRAEYAVLRVLYRVGGERSRERHVPMVEDSVLDGCAGGFGACIFVDGNRGGCDIVLCRMHAKRARVPRGAEVRDEGCHFFGRWWGAVKLVLMRTVWTFVSSTFTVDIQIALYLLGRPRRGHIWI